MHTLTRRRAAALLTALGGFAVLKSAGAEAAMATTEYWPLWSVEGNGGRVYLLAHTYPLENSWHNEQIEALVPQCAAVWSETNSIRTANYQKIVTQNAFDTSARLMARLDPTDQERVRTAAKLALVKLDDIAPLRPWAAASMIEEAYYDAMHLSRQGPQQVLVAKAVALGVATPCEFPDLDTNMQFLGGFTPTQDVQYLRYTMDHLLMGLPENQRMCCDFGRGDFKLAEQFMAHFKSAYAELFAKAVFGRNTAWVVRFQTMLQTPKPSMVVLGFFHLVGPDNVREQLQKAGLTVRRV